MSDTNDAAQEFSERVAKNYDNGYIHVEERDRLVGIMVHELRAGGWVKGRAGPHVSSEDLMSGIQ